MESQTMYSLSDPDFVALLVRRAWCLANDVEPPPLPGQVDITGMFWGQGVPDKQEALIAEEEATVAARRNAPDWVGERRIGRPVGSEKYEFSTMEVGSTFMVPPGPYQPKWNSFRIHCHKRGKALGKVFRCHHHKDGRFEVYREA